MKRFTTLLMGGFVGAAMLFLTAGCGPKEDPVTPGAVPPSTEAGGAPAPTLRDPKVQNDPSVPQYIKNRAGGKQSGPGQ